MTKQENAEWMKRFREQGKHLPKEERIARAQARFKKFNETLRYIESLGYVAVPNGLGAAEHGEYRYFFALPYKSGVEFPKIAGWINADNTITFTEEAHA